MAIPILGDVIREIGGVVRQVLPDPKAQAELDYKFAELADRADLRDTQLLQGQIEVNKVEASSSNLFVAGWRPAIGWVCATALGWTWMAAPLLRWLASLFHVVTDVPALPGDSIYPVVLAMLGISASRTFEKMRGVASSVNGTVPQPTKALDPNQSPLVDKLDIPKPTSKWFK
jgi:hypothetical protein